MKKLLLICSLLFSINAVAQINSDRFQIRHGDTMYLMTYTYTTVLDSIQIIDSIINCPPCDTVSHWKYFQRITSTEKDSIQLNKLSTSQLNNTAGFINQVKTINSTPIVGTGDIPISAGSAAWADITGKPTTTSWLSNSTDKNFVTDAQATVIGNTSGSNSGDNATNTQYSGLAASKQNNITLTTTGTSGAATFVSNTLNIPNYAAGGGPTRTFLPSDVINNNAVANTIADVTGLSFSVSSNVTYHFKFVIVYSSAATTTGSRWSINGPAATFMSYTSQYPTTATAITNNAALAGYNLPAASNASSLTTNNRCIIEGDIRPSASGTVIARFASEIASSAITAVASGKSYVEFQVIN